jgi:hypothetical protein
MSEKKARELRQELNYRPTDERKYIQYHDSEGNPFQQVWNDPKGPRAKYQAAKKERKK